MKTFNTTSALAALAVATALVTSSGAALANEHNYNGVTDNSTVTYSQVAAQQTETTGINVNEHNYNGSTATEATTGQGHKLCNTNAPASLNVNNHNYSGHATASTASSKYDELSAANAADVQGTARQIAWF